MKNKRILLASLLTVMAFMLVLTNSCKKDDQNNNTYVDKGIIFNPNLKYDSVTDIDGNIYKTIKIGTQTWMAENLRVIHYRNGDPIPNIIDTTAWCNLSSGAYCDYNNSPDSSSIYGKLYNWFAVNDNRNLAPIGWHIPTFAEWDTLYFYLLEYISGGKLKEYGTRHWIKPNTGATNESGFTALPGGNRSIDCKFRNIGYAGYWWSSTEDSSLGAICSDLHNDWTGFGFWGDAKKIYGFSVRCIKDN